MRDHGLPFQTAHAIAGCLVKGRQADPARPLSALIADASSDLLGTPLSYTDAQLAEILSARHFVEVRTTLGGPAPPETDRAIRQSRQRLETDRAWSAAATEALSAAERELAHRSSEL